MSNDLDLEGTGFEEMSGEIRHRLIMDVTALEGDGKTHFACTGPSPIGYIDFDIGTEGVVEKFIKGLDGCPKKRIWASTYKIPVIEHLKKKAEKEEKKAAAKRASRLAVPVWEKVVVDYKRAIENFRTLVVDTGTEMNQLLRLARLGQLSEVMPEDYGPVNAEFRDLVRLAYDNDCNVIFLHKMKGEWTKAKGEKRASFTGNFIRDGFNGMGYLPQLNLISHWDKDEGFSVEVTKCRQNADLRGQTIGPPLNTFPFIAAMVFPNTEPEDWE